MTRLGYLGSELGVDRYLVSVLVHFKLELELARVGDDNVLFRAVVPALLDVLCKSSELAQVHWYI